jgi:hypothetical protein
MDKNEFAAYLVTIDLILIPLIFIHSFLIMIRTRQTRDSYIKLVDSYCNLSKLVVSLGQQISSLTKLQITTSRNIRSLCKSKNYLINDKMPHEATMNSTQILLQQLEETLTSLRADKKSDSQHKVSE